MNIVHIPDELIIKRHKKLASLVIYTALKYLRHKTYRKNALAFLTDGHYSEIRGFWLSWLDTSKYQFQTKLKKYLNETSKEPDSFENELEKAA